MSDSAIHFQSTVSTVNSKQKNDHGQYFTPSHVADAMVTLLSSDKDAAVLEPSSGEGVFLTALANAGFTNAEGVEIDSRLDHGNHFTVHHDSFVSWRPEKKYSAVIGNPPYIRWKNLGEEQQQEVKQHHLWGTLFNSLSDYLTVFIANSVEHLEDGGELVFITPSFWLGTKHSGQLRDWLLAQGSMTDLIVFGESEVFKGVSSAIIIFRYVKGQKNNTINRHVFIGGRKIPSDALDLKDQNMFDIDEIPSFTIGKHWTVASSKQQETADALESSCQQDNNDSLIESPTIRCLGEFVHIANGMVSGLDKAFRFPATELDSLNSEEKSALMPVAKAKDLTIGKAKTVSYYIDVPTGLTKTEFTETYPHFAEHMKPYNDELLRRYSYGRDLPTWEWSFRRSEKFLLSDSMKVVVPSKERLTNRARIRFALVQSGVAATQDVTAFAPLRETQEKIEYIVAYLMLKPVSDWIRMRGLMKGGVAEFSEKPLSEIPFRWIDWSDEHDVTLHDSVVEEFNRGFTSDDLDNSIVKIETLFRKAHQRPVM